MPSLTKLYLHNNSLDDDGCLEVARALTGLSTLEVLSSVSTSTGASVYFKFFSFYSFFYAIFILFWQVLFLRVNEQRGPQRRPMDAGRKVQIRTLLKNLDYSKHRKRDGIDCL